ncbi:T9SS type A sorting domain-containing protein [Bacteroidota bacterium]|nr:T9SS type A sorting domain-containing protein [Bacteroidota bacterium]
MKNREVFKKHQAQTFPFPSAIEITSANGNYLIDSNGFKYLDTYTIGQSSYNSSGIYTNVLLDSQGCDSTVVTDLTVTEVIATVAQSGGYLSANISSGLPPYTYTWNTGETGSTISITNNGQYWVIVTDANGCVSQKYFITVSSLPSSTFEVNQDDINIYPNPTDGVVNIELSNNIKYSNYNVRILNNIGEVVYEDINSKSLLMNHLSSGIYTIRLVFTDKIFHSQIIVK